MITSKERLRFMIPPQNAAEGDEPPTLEGIRAMFGLTDTTPTPGTDPAPAPGTDPAPTPTPGTDPAPADPKPANTDPTPNPNPDPGKDPNANNNPPTPQPQPDVKAGQAFAALRVENTSYKKLLGGVAKILGIEDINNPDAMTAKLQDLITKAEAKKTGIPEDVLKDVQDLKSQNEVYAKNEIRRQAYIGFQQVKDQFQLDDAALDKFSNELLAKGINPFENPVNLTLAYKDLHYDELIEAAIQRGIKQEMERAANAANHSSTPNNKTGGQGGSDPEKINTVTQLTDWFNQHNMK